LFSFILAAVLLIKSAISFRILCQSDALARRVQNIIYEKPGIFEGENKGLGDEGDWEMR